MAVSIAGAPVHCSPLRLRALTVLAEAPNHVVTVESLVARLWRPDTRGAASAAPQRRALAAGVVGRGTTATAHRDGHPGRLPAGRPQLISTLVVAYLVAGVLILAVGRRLRSAVHLVSAVPLAITLAVVAWHLPAVHDGTVITERISWVSSLGVDLVFRLDGFSTTMALLVAAIGLIVVVYASGYFAADEPVGRVVRYAGFFTLFAGAMLGLVLADDVWTLFVFWELTSVMSFALIGLDDRVPAARIAAQRALLVTAGGGLVMLGGFVCLAAVAGASDLRAVSSVPATTTAQVGAALVLVGAMSKSAQFPFQFWLPGAMAAPTPVTAYLHSATMVKAGVVHRRSVRPALRRVRVVASGDRGGGRDHDAHRWRLGTPGIRRQTLAGPRNGVAARAAVPALRVRRRRRHRGRRRHARRPRGVQVGAVHDGRRGRARHRLA